MADSEALKLKLAATIHPLADSEALKLKLAATTYSLSYSEAEASFKFISPGPS